MLISREYAKTVLSILAQKFSGVYKKPNTGIPESDLADDVREKLGGGLPDASELENGTAMIAVDGEWKMQEGYGYTSEPTVITFDGDLTGKTVVEDTTSVEKMVHVSDLVPSLSELHGATGIYYDSVDGDIETSLTCSEEEGFIVGLGETHSTMFVVIPEPGIEAGVTFPKSGIYVPYIHIPMSDSEPVEAYLRQLTFGGASVPISHDLIPATSANMVTLVNAEEYFDSDTVEGALAEIGAVLGNTDQAQEIATETVQMDVYEDGVLAHTYYLIAEDRSE